MTEDAKAILKMYEKLFSSCLNSLKIPPSSTLPKDMLILLTKTCQSREFKWPAHLQVAAICSFAAILSEVSNQEEEKAGQTLLETNNKWVAKGVAWLHNKFPREFTDLRHTVSLLIDAIVEVETIALPEVRSMRKGK